MRSFQRRQLPVAHIHTSRANAKWQSRTPSKLPSADCGKPPAAVLLLLLSYQSPLPTPPPPPAAQSKGAVAFTQICIYSLRRVAVAVPNVQILHIACCDRRDSCGGSEPRRRSGYAQNIISAELGRRLGQDAEPSRAACRQTSTLPPRLQVPVRCFGCVPRTRLFASSAIGLDGSTSPFLLTSPLSLPPGACSPSFPSKLCHPTGKQLPRSLPLSFSLSFSTLAPSGILLDR